MHQSVLAVEGIVWKCITDYLKSSGTLEHAQAMANHPRTTKLYERRADEVSLDEYELARTDLISRTAGAFLE
jgi:hypothetical protein